MMDKQPSVSTAFDLLVEELINAKENLNEAGSEAFRAGQHKQTYEILETVKKIDPFIEQVKSLRKEWRRVIANATHPTDKEPTDRHARLKKGVRTPEGFFMRPILQTLVDLGGEASVTEIRERLYQHIKDDLRDIDLDATPSNSGMPRWWNTAMWARLQLVKRGFLESDSPRGVWAVTDAGRRFLAQPSSGCRGSLTANRTPV